MLNAGTLGKASNIMFIFDNNLYNSKILFKSEIVKIVPSIC